MLPVDLVLMINMFVKTFNYDTNFTTWHVHIYRYANHVYYILFTKITTHDIAKLLLFILLLVTNTIFNKNKIVNKV